MIDPVRTALARFESRLLGDLRIARAEKYAATRRCRELEDEIARVRGALASRAREPVSPRASEAAREPVL